MMDLNHKIFWHVPVWSSFSTTLAIICFAFFLTGCQDNTLEEPDQVQEVGFPISAQSGELTTTFSKTYGGSASYETAESVKKTFDGGYILAGYTNSSNDFVFEHGNLWVLKLDAQGDLIWEHTYGGTSDDGAYSVAQTTDGGYIVVGYTLSSDGDVTENKGLYDSWVLKLDAQGDLIWEQTYGGSSYDQAYSVEQTTDGGYILAGYTTENNGSQDLWVLNLDAQGDLIWEQTYGGSGYDIAYSIEQTTDGGYIVAGYTQSSDGDVTEYKGTSDAWVLKLDAQGNLEWEKTYGGTSSDHVNSVKQTSDGGYIASGHTMSSNGDVGENQGLHDAWVLKLDAQGNLEWERTFGGGSLDYGTSVEQISNGGFILFGNTQSSDGDVTENKGSFDSWVMNLDAQGDLIWEQTYGGSSWDYSLSVEQTGDGGYIVAGYTRSSDGDVTQNKGGYDLWVLKLNEQGNL